MLVVLLFVTAVWAGAQNAVAGGGSFITLAVLVFSGVDARTANLTSTVALFPGQVATAYYGRAFLGGAGTLSVRALIGLSVAGGAAGAVLLLATPADVFERLLPFLILFATWVFAWGTFRRAPVPGAAGMGAGTMVAAQAAISVYGGYFGGGIGFMMLAWLAVARLPVRQAAALKNALAGAMNAAAVVIFALSGAVVWLPAAILCAGALLGGYLGALLLRTANERVLRLGVIAIGVALTVALFWRRWG